MILKPSLYVKSQLQKDIKWQEIINQAEQTDKMLDSIEDKLQKIIIKNQSVQINQRRIQRINDKKNSQPQNSQQSQNRSIQRNIISQNSPEKGYDKSSQNVSGDKGLTSSFNSTTINENNGYMWSGISKLSKRGSNDKNLSKNSYQFINSSTSLNFKSFTKQEWSIERFELKQKLGSGQFSTVYKARDLYTDFTVAIKIISRLTTQKNKMIQQVLQEIKIHSYVNHPGIIKFYGFFSDETNIYIILEYSPLGDLFSYLNQKKRLDEQLTSVIVRQVCEAIAYLNKETIIHRDIKPENILLFTNSNIPYAKLADFGLCSRSNTRRYTQCGTSEYGAPEIKNRYGYGAEIDMWSIGILAYELMSGNVPYIQNNKVYFPQYMSQSLQDFISNCLNYNTQKRMNADEALKHHWLIRYNRLGILEQKDLIFETRKLI